MNRNQKYKPIMVFGYSISTFGIAGILMAPTIISYAQNPPKLIIVIGMLQLILFIAGGVGIILKKNWGYYLLKIILYYLAIAFPIGTLISIQMLKYIRENGIKDHFEFKL